MALFMGMERIDGHLRIGAIVFPEVDQMDFTGPFEVLSRVPDSKFHVLWKHKDAVRDAHGLIITPDTAFGESPHLDVLVVPGGPGQEMLMKDNDVLDFLRERARNAKYVFSVCTGTLLCGAAGLLRGMRATTHWSAFHLLGYFGAIPSNRRVVVDGKFVSCSGVTAGIDGALLLASFLRSERIAQQIQLSIEYEPEPPFKSGTPRTASPDVLEAAKAALQGITSARHATARRVAFNIGLSRF